MSMTICRIALGSVALMLAASASAGESQGTTEGFFLCQNIQASPTAPLYVSNLFEANAERGKVYQAYQQMLAAKYGLTTQVSCSMAYKGPGIREKLEGDNARWFQQIRASGGQVIHTGWTYSGPPATTPAAAAPVANAAPAATSKLYQCWMNALGANYMTPAFESSRDTNTLTGDWRAFIMSTHPVQGYAQIRCMEMTPQQAAANLKQPGRTRIDWQE